MADNKQYITQIQDNGRVMISEDVISSIVNQSLTDIEGFVSLSSKPGAEIAEMINVKNWGKGCRVTIGENEAVTIECNVIMAYGFSVITVSKAIQEAVISAVESMTGIQGVRVNVNICGIVRQ